VTYEIKAGPLTLWSVWGRPKLGIISFRRAFATSEDLCIRMGKTSIHPVKVSIKTNNWGWWSGSSGRLPT
jgi:hypothetical protein